MSWVRPILLVFMPLAAGYYLSYLFRVINAVVAEPLVHDLSLDATRLGLLSSVYFLTNSRASSEFSVQPSIASGPGASRERYSCSLPWVPSPSRAPRA